MIAHSSSTRVAPGQTVFGVLADRARGHSRGFLAAQAGITTCVAAALFWLAAAWWPLSSLLLAVGFYSVWGVLDSREQVPTPSIRRMQRALAIIATLACIAAVVGTAFALFVGDSPGPYGVCYGPDGRAFSCDSRGLRR